MFLNSQNFKSFLPHWMVWNVHDYKGGENATFKYYCPHEGNVWEIKYSYLQKGYYYLLLLLQILK